MFNKNLFFLFFFLFFALISYGGEKKSFPFIIVKNRLIIEAETTQGKLNFLFDTASNLSIIDSTTAKEFNLQFGKKAYFPSLIGAIPVFITEFELWEPFLNLSWVILSLEPTSADLKRTIHGIIGANHIIRNNVVEIDFEKQKINIGGKIDDCYKTISSKKLVSCNKSNKGLGIYLPQFPAIVDTVIFKNKFAKEVSLIIDTGSKYELAFISKDSIPINKYKTSNGNYSILNRYTEIAFCKGCFLRETGTYSYCAPMFHNISKTKIMNNEFYGLIGIPFLKMHKKILLNWQERRIFFIK